MSAAGAATLVGALAPPAFAASNVDIQMLQTAAALENLAMTTYTTALTLPYIGGARANGVVRKFVQVTRGQHREHAAAFNAAAAIGGKAQTKPDPAFVPVVDQAVKGLSGASARAVSLGVVALAIELENIAAETYIKDTVLATARSHKSLFASVMGVEAQHVGVLLAVQALLKVNAPELISLAPSTAAKLPAAGSVGFPHAFYPTNNAAPIARGTVK